MEVAAMKVTELAFGTDTSATDESGGTQVAVVGGAGEEAAAAVGGGLAPISLPLFQGGRLGAAGAEVSSSCMVILLVSENDQHGLIAGFPARQSASAI